MIKVLPGYVLIEPLEEEDISSGGIALPETSKDKPSKGKIVAFNYFPKDKWQYYLAQERKYIEIGDTVIYKKWTNQEVQHEGKTYLLVKLDELLAVIE